MITKVQLLNKGFRKTKKSKKDFFLDGCPQKRGSCRKIYLASPKKPNSAARKVAKVFFLKKKCKKECYIPGINHGLQQYSTVLARGGRVRDLPGVKYKLVRGKHDLKRVFERISARSKYGVPKFDKISKKK